MLATLVSTLIPCGLLVVVVVGARRPSGIRLDVEDQTLVVRIIGKDAFYAMCRTLRLPLDSVKGAAASPRRLVPETGLRLPGTGIPGILRAGSYGTGGKRDFWLARRAENVLVIELEPGAPYRRLVLEVPDPNAEAVRLRPLIGAFTGAFTYR